MFNEHLGNAGELKQETGLLNASEEFDFETLLSLDSSSSLSQSVADTVTSPVQSQNLHSTPAQANASDLCNLLSQKINPNSQNILAEPGRQNIIANSSDLPAQFNGLSNTQQEASGSPPNTILVGKRPVNLHTGLNATTVQSSPVAVVKHLSPASAPQNVVSTSQTNVSNIQRNLHPQLLQHLSGEPSPSPIAPKQPQVITLGSSRSPEPAQSPPQTVPQAAILQTQQPSTLQLQLSPGTNTIQLQPQQLQLGSQKIIVQQVATPAPAPARPQQIVISPANTSTVQANLGQINLQQCLQQVSIVPTLYSRGNNKNTEADHFYTCAFTI